MTSLMCDPSVYMLDRNRVAGDGIHRITVIMLTAIQLVSNDNKESNTGPKGVDSN